MRVVVLPRLCKFSRTFFQFFFKEPSSMNNTMIDTTCEEIQKGLVILVVREKLEEFDDVFDKVTRKLFDDGLEYQQIIKHPLNRPEVTRK